ncbi:methyltransferase [Marinobacter sp. X15-166B]|uniref:methyltransferase n=1 Tax=Marinobacter sp. X15-166B TaxID=1897620 RepID=UPI000A769D08|nr:methyltransferase [Marinobacter sp. X15-166B]
MTSQSGHLTQWRQLDRGLAQYTDLWQWVPFADRQPAWRQQRPELAGLLDTLSPAECDHFEQHPVAFVACLEAVLPGLSAVTAAADLPDRGGAPRTLPEALAVDMPGRKRLQAGAFAGALASLDPAAGAAVLDWCCGKGHLARTLARAFRQPVTGFEWDAALVADGNRLARRYRDPVTLVVQDVLAPDLHWPDHTHGVALHACGDLHRTLLCRASSARAPRISLSPCCYALTAGDYAPLSARVGAQSRRCVFGRNELRLAVQETVTAPARASWRRAQLNRWRLGFDALQRHMRGVDAYLPVPPAPAALTRGDFKGFCAWAAQQKQLCLPPAVEYDRWEQQGERCWQQVRRGELLRHVFRRPVEVWLVLDYALFLEEQGYEVALGTFCPRELTPRNLFIDARLAPAGT